MGYAPVKIPKELIKRLEPFGIRRFIKVQKPIPGVSKSGKRALENGWKDERCYEPDDISLQNWLKNGGNYGIVAGQGLAWLDLDDPQMQEKFEDQIDTLTLQSGSGTGKHYGLRTDATENGTILDGKENLGNIQVQNKYIVGPNCNHYSGGKYKLIKDAPIAWVSKKKLEEIFGEYLQWSRRKLSEEEAKEELEKLKELGFDIPITDIIDIDELRQIAEYEFQGAHPIHGSTTGVNFCVNIKKNVWHCFRCNSGGGPLSWLAVKHGLIRCDQAQKGALKGKIFRKVLEVAKNEGFDIKLGEDKEEKVTPDVSRYFEGEPPHFVPAYLANEILEKFHYLTRETDKTIFVYHPEMGTYSSNGEAHIQRQVKKRLGKYFRRSRLAEVLCDIIASTIRKIEETPPHLIPLKNGILNLKTKKLEDFTPEYFILNALPVKYVPTADCPKIKKFLSEIVAPEDVLVLQEYAGFCLWRFYHIHKALLLVGEGANGKSTFLELLRALINNENVTTISIQEFETNRFALASLYGKLANIYPDLSDKALQKTGLFKMLTGGDTISSEYKFKDKFTFVNYAKMIFSCNKVPKTPDDTTAFFRRWIIINFPNQFTNENPKTDKELIQKLTTEQELSGFLNYALEGLERLLKNKKFNYCKTVEETREAYIRASDPLQAFVMDCLQFNPGNFEPKNKVYEAFIKYCRKMHIPTMAKNIFGMKLSEYMPQVGTIRKTINGKETRCWKDLKLSTHLTKRRPFSNYSAKATEIKYKKEHTAHSLKPPVGSLGVSNLEDWKDVSER